MSNAVLETTAVKPSAEARAVRVQEIRMMAMSALLGADVSFDAWRYFGELKHLQPRRDTVIYTEAFIATCVVGRIRPSRTVRAMKQLRTLRAAADEMPMFERFESLLKSYLGAAALSNHELGKQSFAGLDHTEMWAQVGAHIATLRNAGYEVFLNSGTLLGVTREGKLIDHDDDVDLALVLKAKSAREAAIEWKSLPSALAPLGILDDTGPGDPAIFKLRSTNGCDIDLFPAWTEGDQVFVFPHTFGELSVRDVLPLGRCKITGEPIPANPEKMLVINYGAGWKEPDPYFKFNWVRARHTFSAFLEELS